MFPPRRLEADGLPTLDVMVELLERLGRPDRRFRMVQITGTNGKSSTARLVSALLWAHEPETGLRVGRYIDRSCEDVASDGSPRGSRLRWKVDVPPWRLAGLLREVAAVEATMSEPLAYHEVLLGCCFLWFAQEGVDLAVVEVAMGGRRDLTSAADAAVAAVTHVAEDHLDLLGPTLMHVAKQKAGVVKPGTHLVLGETDPTLQEPFLRAGAATLWQRDVHWGIARQAYTARGRTVSIRSPTTTFEEIELVHASPWQADNAALAVATAEAALGRTPNPAIVRTVLEQEVLPGRFERVCRQPLVLLDAAKNAAGIAALVEAIAERYPSHRCHALVLGVWRAMDHGALLECLARLGPRRLCVAVLRPEVDDGAAAVRAARALGMTDVMASDLDTALARAVCDAGPDDLVLVTGSTKLVRGARRFLRAFAGR